MEVVTLFWIQWKGFFEDKNNPTYLGEFFLKIFLVYLGAQSIFKLINENT